MGTARGAPTMLTGTVFQPVGGPRAVPHGGNRLDRTPVIVEEECIACGACEELCPEVFQVNETLGFAQVINPGGAPEEKIQEAMDNCPVNCIHWFGEAD